MVVRMESPNTSVVNLAAAIDAAGGDQELLAEAAGLFLEASPGMLAEVREAVAAGDAARLSRAAHSLKGSVSNFAAGRSWQAALRLEEMGKANALEGVEEACQDLETEIQRLRYTLAELPGAAVVRQNELSAPGGEHLHSP
jgi:two-component system sensor histidine kinase/response regulator